jgi:hypothetical protein
MSEKTKSILMRFVKAALSGMFASMGMVTIVAPSNWLEFANLLNILAISAIYGALTGIIMAGQKWYSWKE